MQLEQRGKLDEKKKTEQIQRDGHPRAVCPGGMHRFPDAAAAAKSL